MPHKSGKDGVDGDISVVSGFAAGRHCKRLLDLVILDNTATYVYMCFIAWTCM